MTPAFGCHRRTTSLSPTWSSAPAGCEIVLVNDLSALHGPGVRWKKLSTLGNLALACHRQMPVPLSKVGVATFDGMSEKKKGLFVLLGGYRRKSYDTAPGTGAQLQLGTASPPVGFEASGTTGGKVFRNVRTADQLSPTRFSSSARTRQ